MRRGAGGERDDDDAHLYNDRTASTGSRGTGRLTPTVREASRRGGGPGASSTGWIIDTSFVVETAWAVIAVCNFNGSRSGQAIFTALLAGRAVIGL